MPIPGGTELIIILVIILLLFGAKRIPELAKGLGTGVREFRRGTKGESDEVGEEKKSEELPEGKDEAGRETAGVRDEAAQNAEQRTERSEQKR